MIVLYTWLITSIQDETRVGMKKYIFRIFTNLFSVFSFEKVTKNEVYLLAKIKFFLIFANKCLSHFRMQGGRGGGGGGGRGGGYQV